MVLGIFDGNIKKDPDFLKKIRGRFIEFGATTDGFLHKLQMGPTSYSVEYTRLPGTNTTAYWAHS
jgi:hypothetical protein